MDMSDMKSKNIGQTCSMSNKKVECAKVDIVLTDADIAHHHCSNKAVLNSCRSRQLWNFQTGKLANSFSELTKLPARRKFAFSVPTTFRVPVLNSFSTNCSHQINLVKLDLKCPPPPPYKRLVYHYARANAPGFKNSLAQFNWADQLNFLSEDPMKQVELLDTTLLNVADNYIPHNEKVFVPCDPPLVN